MSQYKPLAMFIVSLSLPGVVIGIGKAVSLLLGTLGWL